LTGLGGVLEEGNLIVSLTCTPACGSVEPTHVAKSRVMNGAPGQARYYVFEADGFFAEGVTGAGAGDGV